MSYLIRTHFIVNYSTLNYVFQSYTLNLYKNHSLKQSNLNEQFNSFTPTWTIWKLFDPSIDYIRVHHSWHSNSQCNRFAWKQIFITHHRKPNIRTMRICISQEKMLWCDVVVRLNFEPTVVRWLKVNGGGVTAQVDCWTGEKWIEYILVYLLDIERHSPGLARRLCKLTDRDNIYIGFAEF